MSKPLSSVKGRLKDSLFRNWVASVLMLDVAKCALWKLVVSVSKAFFQSLKKLSRHRSLCDQCESRWTNTCEKPSTCPSGFLKEQIIRSHRYGTPVLQNTNFEDCKTHYWAVATCFMPYGYKDKTPKDTDFSGVLSVVIHNIEFTNHIDTLQHPGNTTESVFYAARDVRNFIMHASPLLTSETSKMHYKEVLVIMLKSIRSVKVKGAIKNIRKLEHDDITEKDVCKALEQSLKALTKFQLELKETIPNMDAELKKLAKTGIKAIEKNETAATDLMQNTVKRKAPQTQSRANKKRCVLFDVE